MKTKSLTLHCDEQVAKLIIEAIYQYADAAFPPGSSECAQASREAVISAVEQYMQTMASNRYGIISKRQKQHWKTGIKWYFNEVIPTRFHNPIEATELLMTIFKGETINIEQLNIQQ